MLNLCTVALTTSASLVGFRWATVSFSPGPSEADKTRAAGILGLEKLDFEYHYPFTPGSPKILPFTT